MKITTAVEVLERGDVAQERGFEIKANARAFQILSSNLYTNKIRAVIRELSCNALDSHVMANRAHLPFDVHLPNALEPWFSVIDYGVGLSHQQVMTLYTTYFDSDKVLSNEVIGGLGLGSKAPFSYTNNFDVISTYDGVRRSYAMFVNEHGQPSCAFLGETPAVDELGNPASNGVQVRLPVNKSDFGTFAEEAQQVFRWFSHRPNVSGNNRYVVDEIVVKNNLEGPGWRLVDLHRSHHGRYGYGSSSGTTALMGNVPYPIKPEAVDPMYRQLLCHSLVIDFAIGELDVSASREELSYDPITVKVIEARLGQVVNSILDRVRNNVGTASSLWQARALMTTYGDDYTIRDLLRGVINQGKFDVSWQSHPLAFETRIEWSTLFKNEHAPGVSEVSQRSRATYINSVVPKNKTVFVLKDVSNASARCKQAYFKKVNHAVYLISGSADSGWDATKCKHVQRLLAHLGNPPTILASTLPNVGKRVMKFKGRAWTGRSSYYRSRKIDQWDSVETEMTTAQGGYYVSVEGLTPVNQQGHQFDMDALLNLAKKLNLVTADVKVWGINKTNSKLIKDKAAWIEIYSFVSNAVAKLITDNKVTKAAASNDELRQAQARASSTSVEWMQVAGTMKNAVGDYVRSWHQAESASKSDQIDLIRKLALVTRQDDLLLDNAPGVPKLGEMFGKIKSTYPMMIYMFYHGLNDQSKQHIRDYVKLVDATS
jgi:hypothetical protein